MGIWGSVLGAGVFTYIPYTSFYALYIFSGIAFSPIYGLIFGFVYGFTRALTPLIYVVLRNNQVIKGDNDPTNILNLRGFNKPINIIVLFMLLLYSVITMIIIYINN
ncbi:hypothetical protein GCM10011409_22860 [Lentibacillus populi]|uniref:Uncharacterized protein n=1 Tax=Lentibacillus populi TaxID=1827502 RepID=A0A9W5TXX9_9BACI|nr:hypothetical protein GCM10011409_22860 [Lentibacillus populi]